MESNSNDGDWSMDPAAPIEILLAQSEPQTARRVADVLSDSPVASSLYLARSAREAVQRLQDPDFLPDLMLLDANLGGPEVGSLLSLKDQNGRLRTTSVVVLVSDEAHSRTGHSFPKGGTEIVEKPQTMSDWRSLLERAGIAVQNNAPSSADSPLASSQSSVDRRQSNADASASQERLDGPHCTAERDDVAGMFVVDGQQADSTSNGSPSSRKESGEEQQLQPES